MDLLRETPACQLSPIAKQFEDFSLRLGTMQPGNAIYCMRWKAIMYTLLASDFIQNGGSDISGLCAKELSEPHARASGECNAKFENIRGQKGSPLNWSI
jgi:hypothetical protein